MILTPWENLSDLLESNSPTVKVGLFFNTSYEHTQFLLQDSSYHLKSRLEIEVIEAKTIYEVENKYQDLDMIITNLSALTLPNCSIVSIHANPTADDFVTILNQYNKVVNNKIDTWLVPRTLLIALLLNIISNVIGLFLRKIFILG